MIIKFFKLLYSIVKNIGLSLIKLNSLLNEKFLKNQELDSSLLKS